jgi:RNA polymerase sigma factor (sigma-70 family)
MTVAGPSESENHRAYVESEYATYYGWLRRFFLHHLRNEAAAEEYAQETIFRFLDQMKKRNWEPIESVDGYLAVIAYHLRSDYWRNAATIDKRSGDEPSEPQLNKLSDDCATIEKIDKRIDNEELRRQLQVYCVDLSEQDTKLICMHFVQEMSFEEIATATGLDICSLKYEVHKIMMRLRSRVKSSVKNNRNSHA